MSIDDHRRRRRIQRHNVDYEIASRNVASQTTGQDPYSAALLGQRLTAIHAAISTLSSRDADLIRRRHIAQETYAEIAAAMGMSSNHVGVALLRAERHLQLLLSRQHAGLFD